MIQAPYNASWQHGMGLGFVGLVIGLLAGGALIIWQHRHVAPLSEAFLAAQTPILQYQAEKGAWPEDFDLLTPPESVGVYGYGPVRAAVMKLKLPGKWSFTSRGAEGLPALVFLPESVDADSARIIQAMDLEIDDGDLSAGRCRLADGRVSFTLIGG